jgi:ABC-type Fe3+/spermidine/putrescine transport system ATPase subunit
MAFVELKNLTKRFGDLTAVDNVSLEVEEGEFLSILGPSGSGKTTLLKMIAGFEDPTSGDIIVDGESIVNLPPEDRAMNMVFQHLALFPHLSVFDNIAFGLRRGTTASEEEIERRVHESLELVDLAGYGNRNIPELSGGEQQRVALARAIVVEPKVLLFDEPLSDLDKQLREELRREIGALHNDFDITSIYVTHNQREALTLADRIAVMNDGEIVQIDPPSTVYNTPESKFIADFVGESSFLTGKVIHRNGSLQFVSDELALPVNEGSPPGQATMFFRPENIELGGDERGEHSYECTITSIHHLGSTTEYQVDVAGETFTVTELGQPHFSIGEATVVTFKNYDVLTGGEST